jgi:hypothetical protein
MKRHDKAAVLRLLITLIALLLPATGIAQEESGLNTEVKLEKVVTKPEGAVAVNVTGEGLRYTLSCHQSDAWCKTPTRNFVYVLNSFFDESVEKYHCQSVRLLGTRNTGGNWDKSILKNGKASFLGFYCLDATESLTKPAPIIPRAKPTPPAPPETKSWTAPTE